MPVFKISRVDDDVVQDILAFPQPPAMPPKYEVVVFRQDRTIPTIVAIADPEELRELVQVPEGKHFVFTLVRRQRGLTWRPWHVLIPSLSGRRRNDDSFYQDSPDEYWEGLVNGTYASYDKRLKSISSESAIMCKDVHIGAWIVDVDVQSSYGRYQFHTEPAYFDILLPMNNGPIHPHTLVNMFPIIANNYECPEFERHPSVEEHAEAIQAHKRHLKQLVVMNLLADTPQERPFTGFDGTPLPNVKIDDHHVELMLDDDQSGWSEWGDVHVGSINGLAINPESDGYYIVNFYDSHWLVEGALHRGTLDTIVRLFEPAADSQINRFLRQCHLSTVRSIPRCPHVVSDHAVLRPDQVAMLEEMVHRENTQSFVDTLFIPSCTDSSGRYELLVSPLLGKGAVRDLENTAARKITGGLAVAPMGFGKTLIGLYLAASDPALKTLVVCPAVVLGQWASMLPDAVVSAYVHNGGRRYSSGDPLPAETVTVVSYATVRRGDPWLTEHRWDRIIFDECHVMKTSNNQLVDRCRALVSPRRWGLTATPTCEQNPCLLGQIKAIVQMEGGNYRFHSSNENYMTFAQDTFAALFAFRPPTDDNDTLFSYTEQTLPIDIPESVQARIQAEKERLTEAGVALTSRNAIAALRRVESGMMMARVSGGVRRRSRDDVRPETIYGTASDECAVCMNELQDPRVVSCGHMFCRVCIQTALMVRHVCPLCRAPAYTVFPPTVPDDFHSSDQDGENVTLDAYRARALKDFVSSSSPDDKFIVFSQFNPVLSSIAEELRTAGIGCVHLRTGTSVLARQRDTATFFDDPSCRVMVLNIRWANAGLNLTAANNVVFMESPASESHKTQAIGRACRTGQTRDVLVSTFAN